MSMYEVGHSVQVRVYRENVGEVWTTAEVKGIEPIANDRYRIQVSIPTWGTEVYTVDSDGEAAMVRPVKKKPDWEIFIEFEHFEPVSGPCDVFYEIQKEIVALMDYREGITEIRVVPWLDHRDGRARGTRNAYDADAGEFIALCKCGEEFRAQDTEGADSLMLEHCEELN